MKKLAVLMAALLCTGIARAETCAQLSKREQVLATCRNVNTRSSVKEITVSFQVLPQSECTVLASTTITVKTNSVEKRFSGDVLDLSQLTRFKLQTDDPISLTGFPIPLNNSSIN